MHILLKTLMGQSIGINVDNYNKVTSLEIKKIIQKKKGIDISEQTILIAGRNWDDNLTYAELMEKNPHIPPELNINHLKLVITPIPNELRQLVRMNYHDLKTISTELANKLSQNSRPIRFKEENHISTQTYWNDLSIHERVKVLSNPEYSDFISVLSQNPKTDSTPIKVSP